MEYRRVVTVLLPSINLQHHHTRYCGDVPEFDNGGGSANDMFMLRCKKGNGI